MLAATIRARIRSACTLRRRIHRPKQIIVGSFRETAFQLSASVFSGTTGPIVSYVLQNFPYKLCEGVCVQFWPATSKAKSCQHQAEADTDS